MQDKGVALDDTSPFFSLLSALHSDLPSTCCNNAIECREVNSCTGKCANDTCSELAVWAQRTRACPGVAFAMARSQWS